MIHQLKVRFALPGKISFGLFVYREETLHRNENFVCPLYFIWGSFAFVGCLFTVFTIHELYSKIQEQSEPSEFLKYDMMYFII